MHTALTSDQATVVSSGHTFLEGPRWHGGALWVSDFYTERVLSFEPQSDGSHVQHVICSVPGRPSGLGFSPDGDLLVVSMLERAVKRWDGTALTTFAEFGHLVDGVANDMFVFESGWALVGNFGNSNEHPERMTLTDLVRISPEGNADLAGVSLVFPNGMVATAGEFVVAETFAGRITAFALTEDDKRGPRLGAPRTWKQFGEAPDFLDIARATAELEALPDGLALDTSGAIWVASSNGHRALRIAPSGAVLESVDVGALSVYALALGGPNLTTLYLCCSPALGENNPAESTDSVLMAAEVHVPGV